MQRQWIILFLILFLCASSASSAPVPLKTKIGQMFIFGFKGDEFKKNNWLDHAIQNQQIGGVVLFDYDFVTKEYANNIKNPNQLKQMIAKLQTQSSRAAKAHLNHLSPLLISIDYEGGKVNRLKENYGFPPTVSAKKLAQLPLSEALKYIKTMAQTVKSVGINLVFGPVVDLDVNHLNPIIGQVERSFSSAPDKVVRYATLFSSAYRAQHILCAYKHFPGHGSSTGDTHLGLVDVSFTWTEQELLPYRQLFQIKSACSFVMNAHVVNRQLDRKGYPASLSKAMTQNLLRQRLHFNGMIITDDLQMNAITNEYGSHEAVRLAINAGANMLIFGNQLKAEMIYPNTVINWVLDDIKNGKISIKKINASYAKIAALKKQLNQSNA